MRRLATLLMLPLALQACVSLTPYAEIERRVPPESFVRVAGQPVHIELHGEGEPVVLLHGFGASSYSWRRVAVRLATSYRVIAVDLNGFGYTERPRGIAPYSIAGQLQLVLGVMDALGIGSAHVGGHSYGGALALHFARLHPERVRTLVLVNSAGPQYPKARRRALARIRPLTALYLRTLAARRSQIRRGLERSIYDDDGIGDDLVGEYFERLRVEGMVRGYRGLTVPLPEEAGGFDLATIRQPTLVVWGQEDELIAAEVGRDVTSVMPDSRFLLLEEVGHLPLEESPDRVADAMLEFLREHHAGRTPAPG